MCSEDHTQGKGIENAKKMRRWVMGSVLTSWRSILRRSSTGPAVVGSRWELARCRSGVGQREEQGEGAEQGKNPMQPKNRGTTSTARPSGPSRTERLEERRMGGGSSCSSQHLDQEICLKCQEFGLKRFKPKPRRLVLCFKKLFLFPSGRQSVKGRPRQKEGC